MKFPRVFYLFILIHIAVALPLAYYLNIWADEASTLYTTKNGILFAIENASNEKQAPLYFILISLWRLLDDSVFFARLFSIFCSLLSIGVFYTLVVRLWNEKTAIFATFFFAFHPYMMWASLEVRLYSLVILFSLVLMALFERAFLSKESSSVWSRYVFTLVAALALATNYYLGFLLVGLFASLIVTGRYRAGADYLLRMGIVLLLVSPLLWNFFRSIGNDIDGFVFKTSAFEGLQIIWNHLLTFLLPTELFPPEDQTWISFVRLWFVRCLLLLGLGSLVVKRSRPDERFMLFASQSAVISIFLLLAYFQVGILYVEVRHASVLFIPFLLFLLAAIVEFAPRGKSRFYFFVIVMVGLTFFYSYGITALYPNWAKRGDWNRVAQFVESNEGPDQPIIVYRNYEALAFIESYGGKNRVLPENKFFEWKYEGEIGTPGTWPKQIEYVISVIPKSAAEIWLVTEERCHTGDSCLPLENFVKENYTVLNQKDFYKERVRLLRKK